MSNSYETSHGRATYKPQQEKPREQFTISEEERKALKDMGSPIPKYHVSEEERKAVKEKSLYSKGSHHRVKVHNTGKGRWPVRVDGHTIIIAESHLEAMTIKMGLRKYLEHLDRKADK